jgi:hypothetical protein
LLGLLKPSTRNGLLAINVALLAIEVAAAPLINKHSILAQDASGASAARSPEA